MIPNTCVIPAAGMGTRWAPISSYFPKEMLPLGNKPVIEIVINEIVASGIHNIIVVINKKKDIIKKYFQENKTFIPKTNLYFVYQKKPAGLADVILLCRPLIKQTAFCMALPDLPTLSPVPAIKQLIGVYSQGHQKQHLVSFAKFPRESRHLYGECKVSKSMEIIHFCPKQQSLKPHHPAFIFRMSGRYIFQESIFDAAQKTIKNNPNEINERMVLELSLSEGVPSLCVPISGKTFDTGYPAGYATANNLFSSRDR